MNISVVASYLEQLCREHWLVAHSDSEQHFVNLNDDKRATALVNELHYPAVYFEANEFALSVSSEQVRKRYTCHIEVFAHVADTSDYAEVEQALATTESIVIDLFVRMARDRRCRSPKWLTLLSGLDNLKVLPLQNEHNALYGHMVEFEISIDSCTIDSINNFTITDNG